MKHFLSILSVWWEPALALVAALLALYLGFRFGRRWREKYKDALANRAEYHALKAEAQMRAAQSQHVEVHASPIINLGPGTINSLDADQREETTHVDRGSFCTFCGRFGCRADCREAVESGHRRVPDLYDQLRPARTRDLVRRATPRLPWRGDLGRPHDLGSERADARYLADHYDHIDRGEYDLTWEDE